MNKERPYHKYVFDSKKRLFVGRFEDMYQDEDRVGFDSWFQEDATHFGRQISLAILNRYNFGSILDIGCGKGAFTHLLKKENNLVVGIDISKTALEKAQMRYQGIMFRHISIQKGLALQKRWDLVVMMEVLSYLKDWRGVLEQVARRVRFAYLSLYLPPSPIGFVKDFSALRREVRKNFSIITEVIWSPESIFILAKSDRFPK